LITFHGSDLFYFPRIWPLRLPLLRSILDASALVTVSTFLRRRLTDLGIPAERIETIPDGVDIRKFHPAGTPREPLILFVGSLVEGKGVSHLIRAMPDILLEHPEYKLVIIGDGHLLAELKGLATKLGIGDAVVFKGAQSQANVSRWMQRAKIVVLPALFEGLGVVLLEALACGTPCIATSVGGISDVISPDVGVLVPPRNPQAISEAVSRVLMNPGEYAERSRQARRLAVERFAWNKIIQRIEHLYWQCLSS
jgi:glycosyltransferase involved in cell wall biosynthesis